MSTAGSRLIEPRVLAHAKRRLFGEGRDADGGREGVTASETRSGREERAYAVTDTQFATERWLAGERLDPALREFLAPFNHVRVGSGYPDLLGVRVLPDELAAVDRLGDHPPMIAIEAKGYTEQGTVAVETGVVQAYDRLHEANAAFVAAPAAAISKSATTLARELNVGLLGVESDGSVNPVVRPRIVGNRTTSETDAIRFQASAQGVAQQSFGLNHPKNYLAYPLAVYHPDSTEELVAERVVGAVESARDGAIFLGLVRERPTRMELTRLGREIVRFAAGHEGSVDAALNRFADWKGTRKRYIEEAPHWGQLARRVVFAYPATDLLVAELQHMHEDDVQEPTLVDLVTYLHELHPSFTVELFLRGTAEVRGRVLDDEGDLQDEALANGEVYHAPTVFQLKAMLYHAGILEDRGAEPSRLDPTGDRWTLRNPI
ncbi:MAG: hypothetical protein ABEI31_02680 [Halodesulfurarchaeum sp.]